MIHQIINDDDDDTTSPAKWRRLLVINGGEPTSFNNGVCRTRCKAPLSSGNLAKCLW